MGAVPIPIQGTVCVHVMQSLDRAHKSGMKHELGTAMWNFFSALHSSFTIHEKGLHGGVVYDKEGL